MRQPLEWRIILALGMLTAWGCTKPADPAPPPGAGANAASPQQSAAAASPPAATASPPAATASSPAAAASQSAAAAIPKAPPTPSADQLAKWAVPECEPLQLLACNDLFGDQFVFCLAISPDGKQYVLGGSKLTLWNANDATLAADLLKDYKPGQVERPIRAVAISADGQWIAAGDEQGKVLIWTLADQQEVVVIDAHQGHISELAFSPDSKRFATTSYSGEVNLWQLPDGKKLKSLKMSQQEIRALEFVSNTQLASAADEANLWNLDTDAKETTLTNKPLLSPALGLSSDRRLLAFNDDDGTVRFWNTSDAKQSGPPLRRAGAQLIAFSSDGKRIATSSRSEIRIWEAMTGSTVQVIDVNGAITTALAWLPGANALAIASDSGRVRIWGVPSAAETLGIETIESPAPSPAIAEHRSLSSARLKQLIDIRSFPRLPDAVPQFGGFGTTTYTAPASQAEAELFYRYQLAKAGWTEAPPAPMSPGLIFRKDDCQLNVAFYPAAAGDSAGEGGLQVSLQFAGNYDVRWLPKFSDDAKVVYESFSSASYRTKGELTDVEAGLLKKFHEAGWTAYSRLAASSREEPDSRTLTMLQGGSELTVTIGRPADSKDELMVQTSVQLANISLPLPSDSGWIEYDASTDLQFVINTNMDLQQTADFYDQQLAADGWLMREKGRTFKDDRAWLPYFREQQDLYLGLEQLAGGGTRIVAGEAANSSWQLQKPVAEKESEPGIEAADFALPAGATAVKFDVDAKQIQFEAPNMTATKLGEQFAEQMEAAGWQRDGAGIVGDDYTFITYQKEKIEIQLRARTMGKKATAILSGDGLLWSKPLPTASVRISYETWLRRNHKPASLDHLDQFLAEMHEIPPAAGK